VWGKVNLRLLTKKSPISGNLLSTRAILNNLTMNYATEREEKESPETDQKCHWRGGDGKKGKFGHNRVQMTGRGGR